MGSNYLFRVVTRILCRLGLRPSSLRPYIGSTCSEQPLRDIGILRPNQTMKPFFTDAEQVLDKEFKLEVNWNRNPGDRATESIAYRHRLAKEVTILGPWSPEMQMAEELKRLREHWEPIAKGQRRSKVDVCDAGNKGRTASP